MKNLIDTHCHTIASGHAYSTINEYATEAKKKGLELICITDHGPKTPGMFGDDIYFLNLKAVPRYLEGVEVLTGIEANILNASGKVDLCDKLLKPLDIVIASLHDVCITPSSTYENTKAVINTIKNPLVHIIGHLGDPVFDVDIEEIVKAAKDYHVALELNEASFTGYRSGGDKTIMNMLELCLVDHVPVTWGSDAHHHTALGEFHHVKLISEKSGLKASDILNTSVESFKAFLKA